MAFVVIVVVAVVLIYPLTLLIIVNVLLYISGSMGLYWLFKNGV